MSRVGGVEQVDWAEFLERHQELSDVRWHPLYSYRVAEEVWAVDIFRGKWRPRSTAVEMARAREQVPAVRPAFLVPEDENADFILEMCATHQIDIIAMLGGSYKVLPMDRVPDVTAVDNGVSCRLPQVLVERIAQIQTLDSHFGDPLREFARSYLDAVNQAAWDDAAEEDLLRQRLYDLLAVDERFEAPYESLAFLRQVERYCSEATRRDHYFHAFHTFLLGCRVIDQCQEHLAVSVAEALGVQELSCVYVWLLAALFHDVGYLQQPSDIGLVGYGITEERGPQDDLGAAEAYSRQRAWYWDSLDYQIARNELVDLWQFLSHPESSPPWHPPTQVPDTLSEQPFDAALREAYLSGSHGVASALRFLTDFHGMMRREQDIRNTQFWSWHIYVAALSIPFHDRRFRLALADIGVRELSTLRFPFAALLAFIDSIQDDRRHLYGRPRGPDILQDIRVDGNKVTPEVDWERLTQAQRAQITRKRDEIADVASFLLPDGLEYVYPDHLLGSFDTGRE